MAWSFVASHDASQIWRQPHQAKTETGQKPTTQQTQDKKKNKKKTYFFLPNSQQLFNVC